MNKKLASIISGLIFVFSFSLCRQTAQPNTEESLYLNHSDSVKYTGIQSCQPCHADKYETFIQTGMGQSFDSASAKKSSANFKNVIPVYDAYSDLYYWPYLKNGLFYLKEYRLNGKDTVHSRTERIDYIVGSGHHTNSHMTTENGYVFQAPITFYTQKGKWDLPPGFENGNNTRFSRKIGLECMSCHNAIAPINPETENQFRDLPHGIDCERCHGPGELHIREKKAGNVVDISKEIDYTIVNPGKLSWNRQIDVCQRCHLQGNAVLKPGKDFNDFRPGMVLSHTFDQFSPEYEGGDDFVMAAHAERFQKSKCFIQTAKGDLEAEKTKIPFTCISCHNPHVSVRQTNTLQFNKTCNNCHLETKKNLCTEKPSLLLQKQYNCVECHMPASGTSDIPHVTVHDHYIRKPDRSGIKSAGKLKGLRCITSSNPDQNTVAEAYISYYEKFDANPLYLTKAKKEVGNLDAKQTHHFKTLVHLYYITKDYNKITEVLANYRGEMDPWTNYRIAKAYENLGKISEAEKYFLSALETQANNLDFILQLAVLHVKQKQWKKAEGLLLRYNQLYSKTAETWAYLGLVKLALNERAVAKNHFIKSLQLDPDQMISLQNLKSLYQLSGDLLNLQLIETRIAKLVKRNS